MKKKFLQGNFIPTNKDKYTGHVPIRYMSSWELKLMMWLDKCPSVISWKSESTILNYLDPVTQKVKRYMIDFNMEIKDKNGVVKKYLVEVKPYTETQPPSTHGNKKKSTLLYQQLTYARNIAKWKCALEYAKKNGIEFMILTEKQLMQS